MAEKKPESEVADRRLFTAEGELRPEATEEERRESEREAQAAAAAAPPPAATAAPAPPPAPAPTAPTQPASRMEVTEQSSPGEEQEPPAAPPTDAEQQAGRDAFRDAGAKVDQALREALGGEHRPEQMQVTFENFVASLYMSAMFQLGMLHEQGQQPQVDIVGARQTIDTIAMLEEKTRGNTTPEEKAVLQDALFRLRMAFVQMTNAITRPPGPGTPPPGAKR